MQPNTRYAGLALLLLSLLLLPSHLQAADGDGPIYLPLVAGSKLPTATPAPYSPDPRATVRPSPVPTSRWRPLRIALSRDLGQSFASLPRLALERAASPDLALGPRGRVWLYHSQPEGRGRRLVLSEFQPVAGWIPLGDVSVEGLDPQRVAEADVVELPEDGYRLFFIDPEDRSRVQTAESSDGLRFGPASTVMVLESAADPSALRLDNGHWILVAADRRNGMLRTARSVDGQVWERTEARILRREAFDMVALDERSIALYVGGPLLFPYHSLDEGRSWIPRSNLPSPDREALAPSLLRLSAEAWLMAYSVRR